MNLFDNRFNLEDLDKNSKSVSNLFDKLIGVIKSKIL